MRGAIATRGAPLPFLREPPPPAQSPLPPSPISRSPPHTHTHTHLAPPPRGKRAREPSPPPTSRVATWPLSSSSPPQVRGRRAPSRGEEPRGRSVDGGAAAGTRPPHTRSAAQRKAPAASGAHARCCRLPGSAPPRGKGGR